MRALRVVVRDRRDAEETPLEPRDASTPRPPLVARAVAWLLHPPPTAPTPAAPPRLALAPVGPAPPDPPRPVVAVLGLAPGAGASTIARALAARLAAEDPGGAAVLHTPNPARAAPAGGAAARLARCLTAAGIERVGAAGRLALVPAAEPLAPIAALSAAPLVADVAHGTAAEGVVALCDHVVLVLPPDLEPALCHAVEAALRADGHAVTLVVNRAIAAPPEHLAHAVVASESPLAAQFTLACRPPRGRLGEAIAEVAERSRREARR